MDSNYTLYNGDCLDIMKSLEANSIDFILCDLPYGTTKCSWDVIIPFEDLWKEYERIIKDNGCIALFGTEPFSSAVRMSNPSMYRYDWYWHKTLCSNFLNAKKQPFFKVETISIFYRKCPTYNPQMVEGKPYSISSINRYNPNGHQQTYGIKYKKSFDNVTTRYPDNLIEVKSDTNKKDRLYPAMKPVQLCEYLIKTYTNCNDIVLDNCMGSGSTGVACAYTGRKFIGIEQNKKYFDNSKERVKIAFTERIPDELFEN